MSLPEKTGAELLLDVRGLSGWYGAAQILFDVDLQVRRGEVVALDGSGQKVGCELLLEFPSLGSCGEPSGPQNGCCGRDLFIADDGPEAWYFVGGGARRWPDGIRRASEGRPHPCRG